MRRLTAILFLCIVVFNLCGYRLVLSQLQKCSDLILEQQLDRQDYNEADLIHVKSPLNLPYYSSSPIYERVYGSISIDGKNYEYVKRRVYQDTLELLCLPNRTSNKLQALSNELAKSSADGTLPVKKTTTLKLTLPDLFSYESKESFVELNSSTTSYAFLNILHYPSKWVQLPDQPPQAV